MPSSLRTQILFLALLPPLAIALTLGLYLSYARMQDLQNYTEARGNTLLLQLGIQARNAILDNDLQPLQNLGNASLEEEGVRAISFFNAAGRTIVHSGPSLKLPVHPDKFPAKGTITSTNENIHAFIAPVYRQAFTSNINDSGFIDNGKPIGWVAAEYNLDDITIKKHQHLFIQNLLMILALVISALTGLRLAQQIINDIKTINNTVKRIKEGDSSTLHNISSSTEMRILAANIEDMTRHLKNELDEMRHNVEISTNDLKETIETIEIQNIELNLAKKEAQTASKIKSEFLANTSHEIRTPLNGIIGFARILGKTPLKKQQQEYVDTIQQSSENLLAIINDILDFSKIEAGKLELELAPFNIRHIMEECVNLFAPYAYEKNIEIVLMIYQDTPLGIIGDSLRIRQIVSNLLSNAIKFTHQGTIAIRVSLEHINGDMVQLGISVSDTGVGMTALQQKNIFQAFTQANSSISREYGGTGLGLAIVKRLVELMDDDIKVESSPDNGSTFSFTLKARIAEYEPPAYQHLEGKTMLIMEKHALLNLSIQHLLSGWGIKVLSATTIDECHRILAEYYVDIIIYGLDSTQDHTKHLTEIDSLSRHSKPLLLLSSAHNEKQLGINHQHISISYKPVTEARLYHSLYDIIYPQQHYLQQRISPPANTNRHLQVLAVDDHPANLRLLNALLSDLNFIVTNASNGQEAIELCREKTFDIIFMDIQMPVINGLNATRQIREEISKNRNTPIIALTAHAMADEKDNIFKTGMNDYITKPINEEQLQAIVEKWCLKDNQETNVCVDTALCMKLANYKDDLAIDMFTMFLASLPGDIRQIESALLDNEQEQLLALVHKLHGACCYTGVPELKSLAQRFEYAIKNNNSEQYQDLFRQLDASAQLVIEWGNQNDFSALVQLMK